MIKTDRKIRAELQIAFSGSGKIKRIMIGLLLESTNVLIISIIFYSSNKNDITI